MIVFKKFFLLFLQLGMVLPFSLPAQTLNLDKAKPSTQGKTSAPADIFTAANPPINSDHVTQQIAQHFHTFFSQNQKLSADKNELYFCQHFQTRPRGAALSAADFAAAHKKCARHADFFAWAGAHLNDLGDAQNAAIFLERGLFLAPQRLDLQIEYAKALAQIGDLHAARALIAPIAQRQDLPPELAPELQRFSKTLAPPWKLHGQVLARQFWHSNITHAPSSTTFSLTLPNGTLPFSLAPQYHRQHGASQDIETTVFAQNHISPNRELQLLAHARARNVQQHAPMDLKQTQFSARLKQDFRHTQLILSTEHQYLAYDGQSFLKNEQISSAIRWSKPSCSPQIGIEGERRRYPHSANLDGHFFALQFAIDCTKNDKNWLFSFKLGRDEAKYSTRAGGDQQIQELRFAYRQALPNQGEIQSEAIFFRQDDTQGYHAWFEGGRERNLRRWLWRIDYQQPITTHWSWIVGGEYWRQNSNLPLFANKNASVYAGIRYHF